MEVLHKIFRVWENVQFPNWGYATLEISFVTDDIWCLVWYSTGKNTEHLERTIETLDLTFWFAPNGLATTINKYGEFHGTRPRSVMGENATYNVRN